MPPQKRMEGRNGEIWRKYTIHRWTQQRIAEEYGITRQRVAQVLDEVREQIRQEGGLGDVAVMRQQSLELYSHAIGEAMKIAELAPAPVFVGKDGDVAIDPESREPVRDYSTRLKALETAAKMEQEIRKLMGLDAATRAEVTASVKYEVVSVDVDSLT